MDAIREVIQGPQITPVPLAPSALRGIINLRSEVLPVVQVSELLGIKSPPRPSRELKVLVLSIYEIRIGILVDKVDMAEGLADSVARKETTQGTVKGWEVSNDDQFFFLFDLSSFYHSLDELMNQAVQINESSQPS